MKHHSFIVRVLEEAAKIAIEKFGKVTSTIKGGDTTQVLTEADLAIGRLIINHIQKEYPQYNVIDEEAGVIDNKSEFTWVVDPIDGTSNFASGAPMYGVMIGLLHESMPIAGGIALPYYKEIYTAEKKKGAFCNGSKIAVSKEEKLSNALIAYGIDGHKEDPSITYEKLKVIGEMILNCRNVRTSNSAFDFILVAKGSYGAFLNKTSKIWDNIAPHIIIEEAGGLYTDFYGNPMNYVNPLTKVNDYFTYCAAAPEIHRQLQEIIHRQ